MKKLLEIAVLAFGASVALMGQTFTITTIAGSLPPIATAPNNLYLQAPDAVLVDPTGNIFIADTNGNRVWKVDTKGVLTAVAGTGVSGNSGDGKAATQALLSNPSGLAMDSAGNLYISDRGNNKVRKVDASGVISVYAGNGTGRFSGDGQKAATALLNGPRQLAVDANDNLYIADTGNHRIRKVNTAGIITTVAGSNTSNSFTDDNNGDGGPATQARLDSPEGVGLDGAGNLYISDTGSCSLDTDTASSSSAANCGKTTGRVRANRIRKVDTNGIITTVAGRSLTAQELARDASGNAIPKTNAGTIPYASSCGKPSFSSGNLNTCVALGDGRAATLALLATPAGIAVDKQGNIWIADRDDGRIRFYNAATGSLTSVAGAGTAGDGGSGYSASTPRPSGMALGSDGSIYFTERGTTNGLGRVRKVDPTGVISTVAGIQRSSADGPALSVALNSPIGIVGDSTGVLYVSDTANHKIRKIDTANPANATTIAGTGSSGNTADGNSAVGNRINSPQGLALDQTGLLYFAERGTGAIRTIGSDGNLKTLAGGGAIQQDPYSGPGTDLSLSNPTGVAIDTRSGDVYFSESGKHVVRRISAISHTVTTVAGQYGISGQAGDGGPATQALLNTPLGIAFDSSKGVLYIVDNGNHVVRVVGSNGIIVPLAGELGFAGRDTSTSSFGYQQRMRNPEGVAVSSKGNVYITDTRNDAIREVVAGTGVMLTVTSSADNPFGVQTINFDAGTGGDPTKAIGDPTKALLSWPRGIWVDSNENVFFADSGNGMVRELIAGK